MRFQAAALPHRVWICLSLDLVAVVLFFGWLMLPAPHPLHRGPPVDLPAADPG